MRVELRLRPLLSRVTPGLAGAQQYSKLLGVVVPFTGWINQSIKFARAPVTGDHWHRTSNLIKSDKMYG